MTTTIDFTTDEICLLMKMAKSHVDKLDKSIEVERELEQLFGAEQTTPRIGRLEAEQNQTYALWEKIENKEKENFRK